MSVRFVTLLVVSYYIVLNATTLLSQAEYFSEDEKAWIKAHPVIQFGYEPDWPPYEIYNGNEYTGIVGEYVKILERETGINFIPIDDITWDESFTQLLKGEIHFVPSCAVTRKRAEQLLFTQPIIHDPLVIITRKDVSYTGEDYLTDKVVALPINYYTQEIVRVEYPDLQILNRHKIIDCLKAVSTGEADAFIGSLGVVSYYINHHGFTNLKIASPTALDVTISMACNKEWATLRDIANKVIDRVNPKEQGEIREKWIAVRYEYGISMQRIITISLIGVGIVVLIFVGLYLWNYRLRREIEKRKKVEHDLSQSIEEIKKQSDERKLLLQEVHHRVKNNLQIIISMLRLQSASSETNHKPFDLEETIRRINAISIIHEMIYKSETISIESVSDYFKELIDQIISTQDMGNNVKVTVESDGSIIGIKTLVPMAIIINELVINSLKHGFSEVETGEIHVEIAKKGAEIAMNYRDNGKWKDSENEKGFGSSLIEIFTEQLDGRFHFEIRPSTYYQFHFLEQRGEVT